MTDAKRRLAAILAADVAGYGRLMGVDERATLDALNVCRDVFRNRIVGHDGRVVDTAGDSVLAVFDSVVEAVQCAVEVQTELASQNADRPTDRRMDFRIGVNLGDVIEQNDGTIYGDGVNIAARVESLAEPGGVAVSEDAQRQVRTKLPQTFEDIGEHKVKNIAEPVRVFRIASGDSSETESVSAPAPADAAAPALAVLPFANLSPDPEQAFFADGIVEEIITALSRFGDLTVLGRVSTLQYKDRAVDVRDVGRELGVDYVLEGSVRRGGNRLRITVQLLDTKTGGHLWAETYDRDLTASDIFDIQDDITAQVVSKVGGAYGAVARQRMAQLGRGRTDNLAAYDSMRLYHKWLANFSHDDYWAAREALETAITIDPTYADAWAGLSSLYACEVTIFYDLQPNSLDRALEAAQQAVGLAPDHAIGHRTLAHARLMRREDAAFLEAAEQALSVNPNDVATTLNIGAYFCFAGAWERGMSMVEAAMARWPVGASMTRFLVYLDHYRKGAFEEALAIARDGVQLGPEIDQLFVAAACGELGRQDDARAALNELRRLKPDAEVYLKVCRHRIIDHIIVGLRKAGLDIADPPG